ncbi:MAG: hypothetical protein IBJ11_04330 [Phycisphaerales bacterium]|nr:hypothetical protein [Phycisphaerales bacterium]
MMGLLRMINGGGSGRTGGARGPGRLRVTRRGVVGILGMMFLVLFGSLAAAMAVVSQGNLRAAASHLHVVRAQGAADTGMGLAESRLREAGMRFRVAKGVVDAAYVRTLWNGTIPTAPRVTIQPPAYGRAENPAARNILEALRNQHDADPDSGLIGQSAGERAISLPRAADGWLVAEPIVLTRDSQGNAVTAAQITYSPPDSGGQITVAATGYDWDPVRERWVSRTAQQKFQVSKRVDYALVSSQSVQIGRGAVVEGQVAVNFNSQSITPGQLDGPPITVRSDFYGLDPVLDRKLDDFFAACRTYDTDGDNRLRVGHPRESLGLNAINSNRYGNDTGPSNAFTDMTRDGYVDDYDIFLKHFARPGTTQVVLSDALKRGTPNAGLPSDFTRDDRLALLIDSVMPDRNRNGKWNGKLTNGVWDYSTFPDNNRDGTRDVNDIDPDDIALGYRDGVLDYRDPYFKIRGTIQLRASRATWEASKDSSGATVGSYTKYVQGPVRPSGGQSPVAFGQRDGEIPTVDDQSFTDAAAALRAIADANAVTFRQQVEAQKGPGWTPPTRIESTPFGSSTPADWFVRPVYENMTFKNVTIPMGNNGLFVNCTFVGVTRVETYTDNSHPSFVFYGEQQRSASTGLLVFKYPPPPAQSPAQLDQSYSQPGAPGYDRLPPPLMVNVNLDGSGARPQRCTNTKLISNNIRFHDCTIVGSVVSDMPRVFLQTRNKLQFTGSTKFTDKNPANPNDPALNPDPSSLDEIRKSSLMAPNMSVDIGSINPPPTQDVNLNGAIVAGVLDVRGNASINGILMSTFNPVRGQAPLSMYGDPVGNPADYNVTIGFIDSRDGDKEGIDLSRLSDLDGDGQLDIGWDSARDANGNLITVAAAGGRMEDWWFDGVPDNDASISPGTYVRRAIRWNGTGTTRLLANPTAVLPDGLALPLRILPVEGSYRESRLAVPSGTGTN